MTNNNPQKPTCKKCNDHYDVLYKSYDSESRMVTWHCSKCELDFDVPVTY